MSGSFILIDHSIEDSTGHYLEYAKCILKAAKSLGFKTVLGVNSRADDVICLEADIVEKAFSRSFWENQSINLSNLIINYLRKSIKIAGNLDCAQIYAEELQNFFIKVGAETGDLVFVPTLGGIELIGIAFYTETEKAIPLDWHLLFRRDVASPKSSLPSKAHVNLFRIIKCFTEFNKHFSKGRAAFYTDTEELTERYSSVVNKLFTTLPIPIEETLNTKKITNGGPLIVSYLGDAREEKGFNLLPKLIANVRSHGFNEKDVRFRIQANFPLSGTSMLITQAKRELIRSQDEGLEILDGPFSSYTYHQLISSSDIILIPYSKNDYRARSSGIFAEALAAGVPTIYPRGTWMEKTRTLCGSLAYDDISNMHTSLLTVISNYYEHQEKSIAFSTQWRKQNSPKKLLQILMKKEND